MTEKIPKETELSKALNDFYTHFPLTRLNVQDEYINYRVSGFDAGNKYALAEANHLISTRGLPLKAELTGVGILKNLLRISAK